MIGSAWWKMACLILAFAPAARAADRVSTVDGWIAGHAAAVESVDPADHDFADLAAFGRAVGDRPLVALGEWSHGDARTFDLKARLVAYLHEEKGFDVLFLESGLYDASQIWSLAQGGKSVGSQAPDNLFYMYAKSREGQSVLRYVDEARTGPHPLILAGIDAQHSGGLAKDEMPAALDRFLAGRGSALPQSPGWAGYRTLVHGLVAFETTVPDAARQQAFFATAAALDAELCGAQPDAFRFPASPGWWCRIARSLVAQARDHWTGTSLRDTEMAENLHWLLEHPYKGRKAILWAHSVHADRIAPWETHGPSMGKVLDGTYHGRYYVADITVHDGSFLDYATLKPVPVPSIVPGSLEAAFARRGWPFGFVDLAGAPEAVTGGAMRSIDYQYLPITLANAGVDGLFYIRTAAAAEMIR
ncbi:MAG TPA: erythromycin esterase family protein [Aliidongia sp.]|uniref:erythromycin esterase family protein n=1 Tax=Aliidongia sp. TaxID=1914230 RepID=UPI002DDD6BA7|nr:erythromycin esterase family protein [Aliidongia sp.]HEV2676007.1 erythromycin esterase family protein [Aliidongia sp.]